MFPHLNMRMFTVMSHWSVSRPVASAILSILSSPGTHLLCPITLCHGYSAALEQQDFTVQTLLQIVDVDIGIVQLKALALRPEGS